jgi:hypothetical protein
VAALDATRTPHSAGLVKVFNTASLIDTVTREYEAHWVMPLKLGSVHYLTANFSVESVIEDCHSVFP